MHTLDLSPVCLAHYSRQPNFATNDCMSGIRQYYNKVGYICSTINKNFFQETIIVTETTFFKMLSPVKKLHFCYPSRCLPYDRIFTDSSILWVIG